MGYVLPCTLLYVNFCPWKPFSCFFPSPSSESSPHYLFFSFPLHDQFFFPHHFFRLRLPLHAKVHHVSQRHRRCCSGGKSPRPGTSRYSMLCFKGKKHPHFRPYTVSWVQILHFVGIAFLEAIGSPARVSRNGLAFVVAVEDSSAAGPTLSLDTSITRPGDAIADGAENTVTAEQISEKLAAAEARREVSGRRVWRLFTMTFCRFRDQILTDFSFRLLFCSALF